MTHPQHDRQEKIWNAFTARYGGDLLLENILVFSSTAPLGPQRIWRPTGLFLYQDHGISLQHHTIRSA